MSLTEERKAQDKILVLLAGGIATKRFTRRNTTLGWEHDLQSAFDLASRISGSDRQVNKLVEWLRVCAEDVIEQYWSEVRVLADGLLERKTLSWTEVEKLIVGTDIDT